MADDHVSHVSLLDLLMSFKSCNIDWMSGTDLAYIGDSVFELFIRSKYCTSGHPSVHPFGLWSVPIFILEAWAHFNFESSHPFPMLSNAKLRINQHYSIGWKVSFNLQRRKDRYWWDGGTWSPNRKIIGGRIQMHIKTPQLWSSDEVHVHKWPRNVQRALSLYGKCTMNILAESFWSVKIKFLAAHARAGPCNPKFTTWSSRSFSWGKKFTFAKILCCQNMSLLVVVTYGCLLSLSISDVFRKGKHTNMLPMR
jgi:hypothetical protein